MCRTVLSSTAPGKHLQPRQLRKHSKSLCGCDSRAASKRMWTCVLRNKYPVVSSTTSLCLCFSYPVPTISVVFFLPNPLPSISISYNLLGWPQLTVRFCAYGKGPAVCWCLFSYHATSSRYTHGKSVPRIYPSANMGHEVPKLLRGQRSRHTAAQSCASLP